MAKIKSEGKCVFCGKTSPKAGISRHLNTHLKDLPPAPTAKDKSLHLRIDEGPYFLNLLVDGKATLKDLDRFLRQIWLECCGHLSQFAYDSWGGELPMGQPVQRHFSKGSKLWYAYDFGSSTELTVKCLAEVPVATPEGVKLLTRNEPLEIWCDTCKKEPATQICTMHYDGGNHFCDDCGDQHEDECDDAEYAMMEIVNSPRCGGCAYSGGSIDLERDGIFEPKK